MPHTWIEISRSAFDHNCAYYKTLIGTHHKLAAVIKGNGYGHGLQEIALLCEQNKNIDWLCVAQLSEAITLHNSSKPILVLGYSDINPIYALNKNIHFMVDNLEYAHTLNEIGKKSGYKFNIHVKIDTGLSRMGILPDNAHAFITYLNTLSYIQIKGIYSHFAASDNNREFTQKQLHRFISTLEILQLRIKSIENIHMSNSASISTISYPSTFNFFRIGLGLYGLGSEHENLELVMTWKTHIAHIKTISANSYIGYANTYQTKRETKIALLPIGYYDGYIFRFSNKTSVLINGAYAPILGRVAMNMTIVDVTNISAKVGDPVLLLANKTNIHPHALAEKGEIKNVREIITGINPLIKRIITM